MIVYFVRHGIAEDMPRRDSGQRGNIPLRDADRRLTPEGRERMKTMGASLRRCEILPELIISSPYVRALETAGILAQETGYAGEILRDERITPSGSFEGLAELLQEHAGVQSLMLVGHNPSMSNFIAMLCSGGQLNLNMSRGAVCCVELMHLRSRQAELLWYAPPKLFAE